MQAWILRHPRTGRHETSPISSGLMRTTVTLDDEVAASLRALARRSGRTLRAVLNETLRRGLARSKSASRSGPFVVRARDLGRLQPGLNLDSIGSVLDRIEGPIHR